MTTSPSQVGRQDPETPQSVLTRFAITTLEEDLSDFTVVASMPVGGMVNPFTGEGIAYAREAGEIAARTIVQALARPTAAGAETVLYTYPQQLKDAWGGYYTLGRTFVQLIGHPSFMRFATRHGVKRPYIMRFTMKLLGNLTEPKGGDAVDRLLNAVSKMTPAA